MCWYVHLPSVLLVREELDIRLLDCLREGGGQGGQFHSGNMFISQKRVK